MQKIKVGAVSYLNTKPLLRGIAHSSFTRDIMLRLDYPSRLAEMLMSDEIDIALLPVAAIPGIPGARIVGTHGIAADGEVASVCIFARQPMEMLTQVYLDYQSRSSVRLATLLLKEYWKKDLELLPAPEDYISQMKGTTAGVIIGDRALIQRHNFPYIYDLAQAWKEYSGLPFVFAAWVANKELPEDFIKKFDAANAAGLNMIDAVVEENPFPEYSLQTYYRHNIHYHLDVQKLKGLAAFLEIISDK
ncbi:MAG: menaquinone biosynthesis protein [Bacteroidetes bacterium]|nr:menaquinone biosynthesis protein [Bacteroidota bacterium]MBS1628928.1 menaquinone biosynthesis protein [Bacteroidota bacterium]